MWLERSKAGHRSKGPRLGVKKGFLVLAVTLTFVGGCSNNKAKAVCIHNWGQRGPAFLTKAGYLIPSSGDQQKQPPDLAEHWSRSLCSGTQRRIQGTAASCAVRALVQAGCASCTHTHTHTHTHTYAHTPHMRTHVHTHAHGYHTHRHTRTTHTGTHANTHHTRARARTHTHAHRYHTHRHTCKHTLCMCTHIHTCRHTHTHTTHIHTYTPHASMRTLSHTHTHTHSGPGPRLGVSWGQRCAFWSRSLH